MGLRNIADGDGGVVTITDTGQDVGIAHERLHKVVEFCVCEVELAVVYDRGYNFRDDVWQDLRPNCQGM